MLRKTFSKFMLLLIPIILIGCKQASNLNISLPKKLQLVTPTNHAPVLQSISNQVVRSGTSVVAIDANDSGYDVDQDGEAITYSCLYDTVIDGAVHSGSNCSSISGLSFNTTTGAMSWNTTIGQESDYEFKIVGSDGALSDEAIFNIQVVAGGVPILDAIANQSVNEGSSITSINAGENGADVDSDGETLTYSCHYDTTVDGAVASGSSCTSITGVSFNTTTGVLAWATDYTQAGVYEFKISATDGTNSGERVFTITVVNVNRAPVLNSISNQTVNENVAITAINANVGAGDIDVDGDAVTYTCYYDQVVDGAVVATNACSALANASFTATTGVLNWTPSYTQSGNYEFKIIGSDGSLTDSKIFTITVNDVVRAPVLDSIANQTVNEGSAITAINAADGGDDFDADGNALTYSCHYDTTINGAVASTTLCSTLTGISFSTSTGVMNWTPNSSQSGTYEFKITATNGTLSDNKIFSITVNNVAVTPWLDAIANQTVNELTAIATVDANVGGLDVDSDGNVLTYDCYYDTTINGSVAGSNSCTSITGVSFNTSTGVMNWTPNSSQSGNYEFKIVVSNGYYNTVEIFSIVVNNLASTPVLDSIANQTVNEGVAISTINAADGGDDFDADGTALTYSCYYDTAVDGAVASTTSCAILTGVSFTPSTGVMTWTPSFTQSGNYEFKIIGSNGSTSGSRIFTITVNNVVATPNLDVIADQMVNELSAIITVNANDGGDDLDSDGTALTYSCFYDTTVNGSVASITACTALTGISFSTSTGVMNWTPSSTQSGAYEFKIVATNGTNSGNILFAITVVDVPATPVLDTISNQTVDELVAITTINAADGGDDFDSGGAALTYTCYYDTTVNGTVASTTACTSLTGVSFTGSTGVMTWTPSTSQSGSYEFKIVGTNGTNSGQAIFTITVNNTYVNPVLDAIANQSVNELSAITTINAGDGGDDFDSTGRALTYTCYVDGTYDGAVASTNACTGYTGISFNTSTGVLNWTPSSTQSGNWEFKITASNGYLTGDKIFRITVANTPVPVVLDAIANQTVNRPSAITAINAGDGGDDFDSGNGTITYTCKYDSTVDGAVANTNNCTGLGASFNTGTGRLTWTPSSSQVSTYEFKITGTNGTYSDSKIFTITVTNIVNRAPVLDSIANMIVDMGATVNIDANDGGDDLDIDGQALTYSCYLDSSPDGSVSTADRCSDYPELNFSSTAGTISWLTTSAHVGTTEFKIVASDGSLTSNVIFTVRVNDNTPKAMQLSWRTTVANESITLPLKSTAVNNFTVNWGDGTIQTVTSFSSPNKTHTYASAGNYTATISGTMEAIYFNNQGSKNNLINVYELGNTGLKDLENAFYGCENLETVYNGNTSKVTTMAGMYKNTPKLRYISLYDLDTSKVTSMKEMFAGNGGISNVSLDANSLVSLTDMSDMFNGATALTYFSAETPAPNLTTTQNMFLNVSTLSFLSLENFKTPSLLNVRSMFQGASGLSYFSLKYFDVSAVTDSTDVFLNANTNYIYCSEPTGKIFGYNCYYSP